jgi:hypothetical protein
MDNEKKCEGTGQKDEKDKENTNEMNTIDVPISESKKLWFCHHCNLPVINTSDYTLKDGIPSCFDCGNLIVNHNDTSHIFEITKNGVIEISIMECPRCKGKFRRLYNGSAFWHKRPFPEGFKLEATEPNEKILCKDCLFKYQNYPDVGIVLYESMKHLASQHFAAEQQKEKCNLVITAPNTEWSVPDFSLKHIGMTKVFLAGGITNCPNWQKEAIKILTERCNYLSIYNPRRENFPIGNPAECERQIAWEFQHLREADIIAFWFSEGSDNPIVLYELGMWGTSRPEDFNDIVIGVHPKYRRRQDVIVQVELANTQRIRDDYIPVHESFDKFMKELVIMCHGSNMVFESEGDGLSG